MSSFRQRSTSKGSSSSRKMMELGGSRLTHRSTRGESFFDSARSLELILQGDLQDLEDAESIYSSREGTARLRGKESFASYDDGVLQPRLPYRAEVPELDQIVLPPLHKAARDAKVALIEALLSTEQADVSHTDPARQTALHFACACQSKLALEGTKVLLQFGADVNAKDFLGSTPLHNAVRIGNLQIVEYLVNNADLFCLNLNPSDYNMDTPLHMAVQLNRFKIAKTLLTAGANAAVLNRQNLTPAMIAKATNQATFLNLFIEHYDQKRSETNTH